MSAFYERFSETLKHADVVLDENYVGNLRNPLTLPAIGGPFPGLPLPAGLDTMGKVQLKSIRAPKFSVEYDVPLSDTVYSLKERLLTDPSRPLGDAEQYTSTSIKLLLKTKVIADTKQLAELPSRAFTVMFMHTEDQLAVPLPAQVYWSNDIDLPTHAQKLERKPEPKPALQALPGVNDRFWAEITDVAKRYVANPAELVGTLRSSYENSMDLD